MNAHVVDQLSAYLDHELSVVEAAAVREHLARCEACAARLAQLAAMDGRLRDLPIESPAQYFDSFASRVRARIETAQRPRRPFRVPAWTWAVAAAVVIAAVLPLMNFEPGVPASAPAKVPVAAAPATSVPPPARANSPAPVVLAEADRLRRLGYARTPTTEAKTRVQAEPTTSDAPGAAAHRQREAGSGLAAAPAPTPAPVEPGKVEAFTAEEADAAGARPSLAGREATRRDETRPQVAEAQQLELEKDKMQSEDANAAAAAAVPAAAPAQGEEHKALRRGAAVGTVAPAPLSPADTEYRALEARAGGASLAQERDAWRAFVLRHSVDPRADEARVRVVALGVDLARRTGADGDRAQARRDALNYLARKDAFQKERVRALLEGLAP